MWRRHCSLPAGESRVPSRARGAADAAVTVAHTKGIAIKKKPIPDVSASSFEVTLLRLERRT